MLSSYVAAGGVLVDPAVRAVEALVSVHGRAVVALVETAIMMGTPAGGGA